MTVTGFILLWQLIGILLLTILAGNFGLPTVSQTMLHWGWAYNASAFAYGLLGGHYYASIQHPITRAFGYAAVFLALELGVDALWYFASYPTIWTRWPILHVELGLLVGALFWGQAYSLGPI